MGYRQIAAELREAITSGQLPEGARLPTLAELMSRYGVAKATANRAIDELRSAGLVVSHQGKPATVRSFRAIRRSSPSRVARARWGAGLSIRDAEADGRPKAANVVVETVPADAGLAEAFGVDVGTPLVARHWRFLVEERPVQIATSYYLDSMVRNSRIMESSAGPGGSYARLEELGFPPHHFEEHLRARMPNPSESSALALPAGTPVQEITRYAFTENGTCVNVNRMVLDASAYVLDYAFLA